MLKVLDVALREFKATVLTKAFLFGVVFTPVIILVMVIVVPLLTSEKPPAVKGSVAVIDRSAALSTTGEGLVAPGVARNLSPDGLDRAIDERAGEVEKAGREAARQLGGDAAAAVDTGLASDMIRNAARQDRPDITVEILPADADVEQAKEPIRSGSVFDGGRLALVVIPAEAVKRPEAAAGTPPEGGAGTSAPAARPGFASYELSVNDRLDVRVQSLIRQQVTDALLDARITHAGLDPDDIRALARVESPTVTAVTPDGERKANPAAQFIIPLAFMLLVWIAVFSGGQTLLASTIEEKSNRVMEVLLSAVSPTQLMAGKIFGQLGVGLVILTIYSGLGVLSLFAMARADMIRFDQLAWLFVFFLIAYFMIASMMAAIGSAVTELQEANALLGPVMMIVMLPMLLMFPIMTNPNGTVAIAASFIPPINPFVMLLRISSTQPPPLWQVLLSAGVGVVAAYLFVRAAAKIFRIGALLYGKPPNFATLVKWVRMA